MQPSDPLYRLIKVQAQSLREQATQLTELAKQLEVMIRPLASELPSPEDLPPSTISEAVEDRLRQKIMTAIMNTDGLLPKAVPMLIDERQEVDGVNYVLRKLQQEGAIALDSGMLRQVDPEASRG